MADLKKIRVDYNNLCCILRYIENEIGYMMYSIKFIEDKNEINELIDKIDKYSQLVIEVKKIIEPFNVENLADLENKELYYDIMYNLYSSHERDFSEMFLKKTEVSQKIDSIKNKAFFDIYESLVNELLNIKFFKTIEI